MRDGRPYPPGPSGHPPLGKGDYGGRGTRIAAPVTRSLARNDRTGERRKPPSVSLRSTPPPRGEASPSGESGRGTRPIGGRGLFPFGRNEAAALLRRPHCIWPDAGPFPRSVGFPGRSVFLAGLSYLAAFFARSQRAVKAAGSWIAVSESILRFMSRPASFRPCINVE